MATIIEGDLLPMQLTLSSPPGARLRQLLVLLLLALGLLAGMSVSQSRDAEAQAITTELAALPALRQVRELAARVDEQRGMAALHLTLQNAAERRALEGRLQASRSQVERHMAAIAPRLQGDAERRHHAAVQASLAAFWAVQDRLLAASRQAAQDPAAAQQARALLAGESQVAFGRLRADIEAWWAEIEQAASRAAATARASAQQAATLVWALAVLAALSLAVAWALLRLPLRPQPPPPAPDALASDAAREHLLALNAAVAAARRGEPGRAAGLSALEAQRLADQVDAAARGLRRLVDRPVSDAPTAPTAPTAPGAPGAPPELPPPR